MAITVYNYDPITGEFLGTEKARVLPLREDWDDNDPGKWQVPAHATTLAPPAVPKGQVACFVRGAWTTKFDHRGKTAYLTATGEEVVVRTIGALSDELTFDPPPSIFHIWQGGEWVENANAKAQAEAATQAKADRAKLYEAHLKELAERYATSEDTALKEAAQRELAR